jgi:hypothetical protein
LGRLKKLIDNFRRDWGKSSAESTRNELLEKDSLAKFTEKRSLKKAPNDYGYQINLPAGDTLQKSRVNLYRFLIDTIPALNAAVWTWTSLSSSPIKIEITGTENSTSIEKALETVERMFSNAYDNRYQKFSGVDGLLLEYFTSLYSTGAVAGELVGLPGGDGIDYFYFIDPASLGFKMKDGVWRIYQQQENKKVWLDQGSTYFYGLKADSVNPGGSSLLKSIPFVARVEQQMIHDMHKSMHNAGYHRIHVRVTPPDRLPGESEKNYVSRANTYFEKTASMFKDFRPEDNPITWNDVGIEYIGPSSKMSSTNSWYMNHRAVIEDICAGTHLAPFMLGYSYGTTHNWAMFKYELVQREVRSVQQAAAGFLEWMANLELALKGFDVGCRIGFANEVVYGLKDKMDAEQVRIKTIIMKKEAGLLDNEEAKHEAESGRFLM